MGQRRGGEGWGRGGEEEAEVEESIKGIPVCGVSVWSVLTVPGCPDYIHVLLQVLDELCQDAVLCVNVLQDLCAVVDVAAPGVLELRGRLPGGGVGGECKGWGHTQKTHHTDNTHTHTHTHTHLGVARDCRLP